MIRIKRLCKFISLLLILSLLSGCDGASFGTSSSASGSWTLCIYLCGSTLESNQGWASKTLQELTSIDTSDNVSVVVQTGGSSKWDNPDVSAAENSRYLVDDDELSLLESAPADSMGNPETLASFLDFCNKKYPADHTAVILWDHGGGPLKGTCFDENNAYDSLSLKEIDEAFAKSKEERNGEKYDLIGFDACLMGSLETAEMLRDDADYLVASEEIESGAGWDYNVILDAMGNSSTAKDVAVSICDGYKAKCESRGKDATATLSVVDLSKVHRICDSLDKALKSLKKNRKSDASSLRRLAFSSKTAESFGGSTENEGLSNLLDIKGLAMSLMAEADLNGKGWSKVVEAIDEAVVYNVNGAATEGAHGLSIWYPKVYKRPELSEYMAQTSLSRYSKMINGLFSDYIGSVIYSDYGSIRKDGRYSVTIASGSHDSFYNLYVVNQRVDGDYTDTNVFIHDDWDNLTFGYRFDDAVRITLNGMTLDSQVISYDYDHIIYSCPVTLNGQKNYLRVAWLWDTEDDGHYEYLGVWNGVDDATGFSERFEDPLKAGDVVGAVSLNTGEEREKITIDGEITIEEKQKEPGHYRCWFVSQNLYGEEYESDALDYEVKKNGKVKAIN